MTFSFESLPDMSNYVLELTVGYQSHAFEMIMSDGAGSEMMSMKVKEAYFNADDQYGSAGIT